MDEKVKERIKFNTEIIKLLVLLFITTGGGALTLIADGIGAAREAVLAFTGMVFAITAGIFGLVIYSNTQKLLTKAIKMNDWFSYLIIGGVFLGGMVPLVAGIIHYAKANKKLDRESRQQKGKGEYVPRLSSLK